MSTNHHGLTSDAIPPAPFSEDELREQWNAQADGYNQWECLDFCEQLARAQTRAIAADRAQEGPRDLLPPPAVESPVVEADPTHEAAEPPLSPAAQAVVDAWLSSERGQRMLGDPACLAAALRAAVAATQAQEVAVGGDHWICEAEELLAIAAELEGHRG